MADDVKGIVIAYALHCQHTIYLPLSAMAPTKTTTLNLRIDPALKEAARIAALQDHRSVANLIELLIRRHCAETGIAIPEQPELFEGADDE